MNALKLLTMTAAIGVTVGCGTGLRSPLCREGEVAFPPEAAGRYRVAFPVQDPTNSGAWTSQNETEFILKDEGDSVRLAVTKALLQRVPRFKPSPKGKASKRSLTTADEVGVLPLSVCRIGNTYYSQTRQENGTYGMARFDISPTGITTSDLMFKPAELRAAGIPFHFLPKFDDFDRDGKWTFDTMNQASFIVDNTRVENREQLLALAHPVSFGMVYTRVSDDPVMPKGKDAAKWRVFRVKK